MKFRDKMIEAMKEHAKGHIAKHKMNVEVYFRNAAGIGGEGNADILEEIEKDNNRDKKRTSDLSIYSQTINTKKRRGEGLRKRKTRHKKSKNKQKQKYKKRETKKYRYKQKKTRHTKKV